MNYESIIFTNMENLLQKTENEIQENMLYGKALTSYSSARVCNIKGTIDEVTLHKGMKYLEACLKHSCLTNNFIPDKNKHLKDIETISQKMEYNLKQELERENLLLPTIYSRTNGGDS